MKKSTSLTKRYEDEVRPRILRIRGENVILDSDLAVLYGVATKALNQAVKRNADRFPGDFAFQLAPHEVTGMWSQIVTTSPRFRSPKYRPSAFTEHGAIMAATVLNSPRAVQMSVFVVRAFVRMRQALSDSAALARKLAALEREVKARLDTHDAAIVDILRRFMEIIDPPPLPDPPPKPPIGFGVKEKPARYCVRRMQQSHPDL